jgi:hypothetical protein
LNQTIKNIVGSLTMFFFADSISEPTALLVSRSFAGFSCPAHRGADIDCEACLRKRIKKRTSLSECRGIQRGFATPAVKSSHNKRKRNRALKNALFLWS